MGRKRIVFEEEDDDGPPVSAAPSGAALQGRSREGMATRASAGSVPCSHPNMVDAVQQDDADHSKTACKAVFDCDIDDCSTHFERTLEKAMGPGQKSKRQKKKQRTNDGAPVAPSLWDQVRIDFNRIKNLPTCELATAACHLFIAKYMRIASKMTKLFAKKCFVFRWTRAVVGAGAGSDNNPLEGTNRTMKDAAQWRRQSCAQFGPWTQNWVSHKARDDHSFNAHFNRVVWNNETFSMVEKWIRDDFLNSALEADYRGVKVLLFPSDFMSEDIGSIQNTSQREQSYITAASLFLDMMTLDRAALDETIEREELGLDGVLKRARSFALLSPADYNLKKTATLWRMLGVPKAKQALQPLSKCTCRDYMHYLVCPHVILFHMHHKQVCRPPSLKLVKHVNKGAAFSSGAAGYPLHTRKIPKGAALSREY